MKKSIIIALAALACACAGENKAIFTDDFRFRMDNLLNEDYNVFYFKSVGNMFFQRGKPFRWTAGITIDL